jgi:RNA recognition motif-containing protein
MQICYDRQTGKPLGYAVAHFTNAVSAQHAIDTLNNVEVDGRHIVVAPYRSRVSDPSQAKASAPNRAPAVGIGTQAHGLILNLHKDATWMYAFFPFHAYCSVVSRLQFCATSSMVCYSSLRICCHCVVLC